ncbi:MAG: hypothetical protein N3A38_16625 [Planctomycetota bacterium]|nr:hypothetical protein [Planctomycetota bacterium]
MKGKGRLLPENGTAGLFARNDTVAALWIYKTIDGPLPNAGKVRNLAGLLPGGANYELRWINPWDGSYVIAGAENLPGENPGGGNPWIGAVDIWTGKMEAVAPTGFDERQREDILIIVKKK